jgi:uncharacterized protein YdhG (YjbR/CyaY superfamily)
MSISDNLDRPRDQRLVKRKPGMTVHEQIDRYIGDQSPAKREELRDLHRRILVIAPNAQLWFLDGRDAAGKVVSNPNIGYGSATLGYANGDSRAFYKLGLSANTAGISVYVMGLEDKTYLAQTYGPRLGKAKVTGYCIRFRSAKDVDLGVLEEVVADALSSAAGLGLAPSPLAGEGVGEADG